MCKKVQNGKIHNGESMGRSGSLIIFLYPDYEVNEAENQKGSKLDRSPYCEFFSE